MSKMYDIKDIVAHVYGTDRDTAATMEDEQRTVRKKLREHGFSAGRGRPYRFTAEQYKYILAHMVTADTDTPLASMSKETATAVAEHAATRKPKTMKFETKCVRAGQAPDPTTGAILPPIYQTATFVLPEVGRDLGFDYTRSSNPTRQVLEDNLAALDE